jgi:hypothetical protein
LQVARSIKRGTSADSSIVVFGDDWNSEIPFFSERKAFVVPGFFTAIEEVYIHPDKFVGKMPSAMLACRDDRTPEVTKKIETNFRPVRVEHLDICDVYFR